MKLSPAQTQMLQGLANGFELYRGHYTGGGFMPPRFRGEARQEFSHAPLNGLVTRGLVKTKPYRNGSFETVYELTDAGREEAARIPA